MVTHSTAVTLRKNRQLSKHICHTTSVEVRPNENGISTEEGIMRYLIFVLVLCSCSSQNSSIQNYISVENQKPKGDCKSLGHVNGVSLESSKGLVKKYENSLNDIKRSVSSLGGNVVHIQKVLNEGAMVAGEAFYCD